MSESHDTPAAKPRPKPVAGKPILSPSENDMGQAGNALLLGIDLGTSRSSIVSYSGARRTVESYVGYPRDAVSRKMFNTDVVFGKYALDNRLALNLFRPLEHGRIKGSGKADDAGKAEYDKNLAAAKDLVRHLVDITEPGRDDVLYGVVGVPAQASINNKQAILDACKETLDAVMIVSQPFSVAYGMERLSDVLVIDIGAGTTDLARMHGTVPGEEDQISFNIAGDAVDLKLLELIKANFPNAQVNQPMCKRFKEQYGYVSDARDKIEVEMPVNGKPTMHDITKPMRDACMILVDPILEAIHKLVASFEPDFQVRLRNNIILAGGGSQIDGLSKKIEDGLDHVGGGTVTAVDEPLFAGADGALKLAVDMPGEYWQQLA